MTYALKLTPSAMALLDGYSRATGQSLRSLLGHHLTLRAAQAGPTPQPQPPAPAPATPAPADPAAAPAPAAGFSTAPATPEQEAALLATLGA